MKSNKDTNTMMKPINSLTNVSSRSSLGGMSRLLSLAVLITFPFYGWAQTDSTMVPPTIILIKNVGTDRINTSFDTLLRYYLYLCTHNV